MLQIKQVWLDLLKMKARFTQNKTNLSKVCGLQQLYHLSQTLRELPVITLELESLVRTL